MQSATVHTSTYMIVYTVTDFFISIQNVYVVYTVHSYTHLCIIVRDVYACNEAMYTTRQTRTSGLRKPQGGYNVIERPTNHDRLRFSL